MSIATMREDDGYRGLVRNIKTGQVMYANQETARNTELERIDSANQKPVVQTSKPVRLVEEIVQTGRQAEPVIEATPEEEISTEGEAGEFALVTIAAEASQSSDKGVLKELGKGIGVKLTKAMNIETMRERIITQVDNIRAASAGA